MSKATWTWAGEPEAADVRALERTCDRFEAAWQSGGRPAIEDYLADATAPARPTFLRELLAIDLVYLRRAGDRPAPEDYHARFPEEREAIDGAFDAGEATDGGRSSTAEMAADPIGTLPDIPGYTVLEELGRGGMGVVFKARAEPLNRFVALKMILAGDLAGPEAAARFRAEAEAVARLQHPQVVQIFQIGEYDGRPFLEMEYVDGGSLADRIDGRPCRSAAAARLVESLAAAVHHAHLRGIVHRDLKPANVLLADDGTPKITDFGLAKSLADDGGLTRTDSIIGSPSYMAPEQTGGEVGRRVGPATDVYSLGAILYELLTGRPPFRAATVLDTLEQVRSADPAPPSRIQPGLPVEIETIVLKCLEKDPARRYPTADALAADLRRFRAGEPISARPVGMLGRAVKWARRRPMTAGLTVFSAASTVLLIVVLTATNIVISRQQRTTMEALRRERWLSEELARANERLADQQRKTEEALKIKTVALEATSEDLQRERQATYYQRIALADAARQAGQQARVDEVLDACPVDLRGWEWRYLKRPAAAPQAFVGHTGEVWDAVFSPDGRRLASASFDHTIKLWDVTTGRLERTLQGHQARAYSVAFDKDGSRLVSASADRTAIIWDVASGRPLQVLQGHGDNVRCAVFSPDGSTVVTGSWDGTIRAWGAHNGRSYRICQGRNGWITRVAFSPANLWVADGGSAGRTEVWDIYSGQVVRRFESWFPSRPGATLGVAFSPDGWRVAASSNAPDGVGVVKVWDVTTGREVLSYRVGYGLIERVIFSPDGRRLATSGWDGTVRLADASTGHEFLVLRGHSGRVWGLNFSARGNALVSASADGKVLLWDASHPGRGPADE